MNIETGIISNWNEEKAFGFITQIQAVNLYFFTSMIIAIAINALLKT